MEDKHPRVDPIDDFLILYEFPEYEWKTCEGEHFLKHGSLQKRAEKRYSLSKDSEETRKVFRDTWREAVPPQLDEAKAQRIQEAEKTFTQLSSNTESESTESGPSSPTELMPTVTKTDKAKELLAQVGSR
jgi:hypothetical protein